MPKLNRIITIITFNELLFSIDKTLLLLFPRKNSFPKNPKIFRFLSTAFYHDFMCLFIMLSQHHFHLLFMNKMLCIIYLLKRG